MGIRRGILNTMRRLFSILSLLFIFPAVSFGASLSEDLSLGSRGDEVKILQEFLARDPAVYPEKLITGTFGKLTEAAVIRFQKKEAISPAAGYVGPKTRGRLNELFGLTTAISAAGDLPALIKQLEALQRALAELQNATSTPAATTTADTIPPVFTSGPGVMLGTPSLGSPFGVAAPVKVSIDWATNEPSAPSAFSCTPELAVSGLSLQATYWAKTGGTHRCVLTVEDPAKNTAIKEFSFSVPAWVGISGTSTVPLAESSKLGDFTVTNASSSSVIVFRVTVSIEENLDAPNSRGTNYKLILRNGTTTSDPTLTKLDVYLHSEPPALGSFRSHSVDLYAGVTVDPGSTKSFGLWVEGLTGPLHRGKIKLSIPTISTIPDAAIIGNSEFTLGN